MKNFIKQQSANGLITLRPTHLLIGKLANLLIFLLIFVSCSKSDNNDTPEAPTTVQTPEHLTDWKPQPKVDVAQPYMAFATGSASATTLSLTAVGSTATATDVWVDTNNNGIFDEGVDKRITDFSKPITFTAASGVFTVYGKVKELTATGNALTAADVRKNEALTKLNVADNQLSEKALLNLVNSLPATTASGTTAVVLRKDTDDSNTVTEAVRIAPKQRGWQALKVEGGKEVPDLPADTQAPKVGTITKAKASAANTIFLEWTAATDNKTPQEKLRYQVVYQLKGSGDEKTTELTENKLSHALFFLKKNKTYVIKVRVMDEDGNTAEYAPKEVTVGKIPGPNGDLDVSRFMILTTDKPIGETIEFYLYAADEDQKGVWIDSNNNGQWDDGIDVIPETFDDKAFYTIKSKKFTVYGKLSGFYNRNGLISDVKIYNPELQSLTIENSNLTSLALASSDALKGLNVADNPLTSLQLGNMPNLEVLNVRGTKLTSLDISAYPKLKELYVAGLAITSLDASKNPLLKVVSIRRYDGKGLIGTPLQNFIKSLPAVKGRIYLSNDQKTSTVVDILGKKGWEIK